LFSTPHSKGSVFSILISLFEIIKFKRKKIKDKINENKIIKKIPII
jgi:hypothetical protein